jgi:hypothetical protein
MSAGTACQQRAEHFSTWVVTSYKENYSAFNGYHRTPSAYSEVCCETCGQRWRTRAAYVEQLPVAGGVFTSRRPSG